MSDERKSDSPQGSRAEKRPHATLDLKAEHVEETAQDNSDMAETQSGTAGPADNGNTPPRENTAARRDPRATGILTHLAAGLLGGLIALTAGFYSIDAFRDSLPFVSQQSAEQIKQQQATLEQRLSEIEQEASAGRAALDERVSALDTRTEGLARADDASVTELRERVDALSQDVASVTANAPDPASAQRIAALDERIDNLSGEMASLRSTVEELRAQNADQVAQARAAALAVALADLRRAVERGAPFKPELDALKRLSATPVEPEILATAAKDGVPTLRALQESFPGYARKALKASGSSDSDSIIGQIVDSARSVVNVRPLGEIEGDGPGAIIARIENRLKAGDLHGAIEQTDALSGEAAVQLLPWVQQARTRIEADKEMDAIETQVLAAIEG
jgi:hypothetical protein